MLGEIDYLSITVDIWCDRRGKTFFGITGHFIDVDSKPHTVLLRLRRLKRKHTTGNIRKVSKDILEELENSRKIFRVITDDTSTMIKAYVFDHTSSDKNNLENSEVIVDGEENSLHSSSIMVSDSEIELTLNGPIEKEIEELCRAGDTNLRLSCFAYSLQLVVCDDPSNIP